MNKLSWKLLLFLAVPAVCSAAEVSSAQQQAADQEMINRVDLGRQEIDLKGTNLVKAGNELLFRKEYFAARDKYIDAVKLFRRYGSIYFREKIEFCQKKIADCYFGQSKLAIKRAEKLAMAKDFEEAIKVCREAIKYCPEQADELTKLIEFYEKRREQALYKASVSESQILPNKESQAYQIQVLLEQGRKLMAEDQLVPASQKFQEVIMIDPFNAEAIKCIEGVNVRLKRVAKQRYINTHRRMITEVEWKYAVPYMPEAGDGVAENVIVDNIEGQVKNADLKLSPLRKKLEAIMIDNQNFTDLPVARIISSLQTQAQRDKENGRGVNIIYMPNARGIYEDDEETDKTGEKIAPVKEKKKPARKVRKEDDFGDEESDEETDEESEEEEEDLGPKITVSGGRSLLEVIKDLCNAGNLEYQIEDYAVVITPKNVTLSDMELRIFPINFPDSAPEKASQEIQSVITQYYKDQNINNVFPKGSKIYYDPRIRRVVVANTVDNLVLIEDALKKVFPSSTVPMVQVMIKLVDINQSDLDELAFNWQLAVNSNTNRTTAGGDLARHGVMDQSNSLLRYYNSGSGAIVSPELQNSTLSFVWQNDKGTRIDANMFALDQSDSFDMLQAPRVTVKDKQMAFVKMVEQHKYPDGEWEEGESGSTGRFKWVTSPQPTLDDEQELGISFNIQPSVESLSSKEMVPRIHADIKVEFKTRVGTSTYDTRTFDSEGEVSSGGYYQFPILNKPRVESRLFVRDGETVVVGGVISDTSDTLNDKIPLLGDIPFIGRFFQSRGTKSSKRNLLVFATFRLVTPAGVPMYPRSRSNGLPELGF